MTTPLTNSDPASSSPATLSVATREYKLMLEPSAFSAADPVPLVKAYWQALDTLISTQLNRPTSGSFSLSHQRTVRFYDTPDSCLFKRNDLIFRERLEGEQREVMLKYRSPDRFLAAHQDLSAIASEAATKFEEDLSAPFACKYALSTTQTISSSKKLNRLDDPIGLYPGLRSYQFDDSLPLSVVGNLTLAEQVYQGPSVDLGSKQAKFTLVLWYVNDNSTPAVVAEISFKYADAREDYSKNVVTRAKTLFTAMQTMTAWPLATDLTKTAYVYHYNPSFCQSLTK